MARRRHPHRNQALVIAALIIALPVAAVFAGRAWYAASLRPVQPDTAGRGGENFKVEEKATAGEIGRDLHDAGLIRSARAFAIYCRLSGVSSRLHSGMYRFSPAMTVPEIATALAEGKISAIRLTIPEGWTIRQIAEHLERLHFCKAADFIAAARPYAVKGKVSFRPPAVDTLEGYLFPATYVFNFGLPLEDAVTQMAREFDTEFLSRNLDEVKRSGLTLQQIVTLASLVEREARLDEERPIIAGVLMNRLRTGMKLQCDATVQYALPEHKSRLTYDDLKVQSPYNTYLHKGLPPGPIANPGLASLEAALRPARTPYLYYVAKGDGGHIFTKTYEEHLKASGKRK
jgi:UPF0755 protein